MDENLFLHSLCLTALKINPSIKFAAIIDDKGKLIVGKFTHSILRQTIKPFKNELSGCELITATSYYGILVNNFDFTFEKNFLSARKHVVDMYIPFQLVEINENLFLAFVALNEQSNKYLCVYIESNKYLRKILFKLTDIVA